MRFFNLTNTFLDFRGDADLGLGILEFREPEVTPETLLPVFDEATFLPSSEYGGYEAFSGNSAGKEILPDELVNSPLVDGPGHSHGCCCAACLSEDEDAATAQDGGPLFNSIPGDSTTTETITVGQQIVEVINFSGDTDWFEITLTAGTTYDISQLGFSASGMADPWVRLFDSTSTEIAENDDIIFGTVRDSLLTFTASTTGTYYISAEAFGNSTGTYALTVTEVQSGDIAGDATTTSSAVINGSVSGTIETSADTDWFEITLSADSRYIIQNNESGNPNPAVMNTNLELRDSTGALVDSNDNTGPGLNARIAYTIDTAGTYYIVAGTTGSSTGDYAITVEEVPVLVERDIDGIAHFLTDEFDTRESYSPDGGATQTTINFTFTPNGGDSALSP